MNPYYIYALKDPHSNPAKPFYIGKGTGNGAWDYALRVGAIRRGRRIAEITSAGFEVVTTVLADNLTETQALKLVATPQVREAAVRARLACKPLVN